MIQGFRTHRLRFLILLCLALLFTDAFSQSQTRLFIEKGNLQRGLLSTTKLLGLDQNGRFDGSTCSGSYIGDGLIVTNFHCIGCIDDCEKENMVVGQWYHSKGWVGIAPTLNAKELPLPTYVARVISGNADLDIAVLRIFRMFQDEKAPLPNPIPIPAVNLGDSDKVDIGDTIHAVGYPGVGGDTITYTEGKIAGFLDTVLPRGKDQLDTFKITADTNPGNSGGLLMDDQGNQIGITYGARIIRDAKTMEKIAEFNEARMINIAVPYINQAKQLENITSGQNPQLPPSNQTITPPLTQTPSFGTIRFGTEWFTDGKIEKQGTQFPTGTKKILGIFDFTGLHDNVIWGWVWKFNGQIQYDQRNEKPWKQGPTGSWSVYLNYDNGMPDGEYQLELYYNGQMLQSGNFRVGNPSATLLPEPPANQDHGVVGKGQVIDVDTKAGIPQAWVGYLKQDKTLAQFDDTSIPIAELVAASAYTDANGYFLTYPGIARNKSYIIIVMALGYERRTFTEKISATDADVVDYKPFELRSLSILP